MTCTEFRSHATAAVLVAAVVLAACGNDTGTTTAPPGIDAVSHTARSDAAITAGVRSQLASDSSLAGLAIEVETSDGRVLLRGIAPDTAVRRHAAERAREVAGVVEVNNNLSVQVSLQ